MSSPKKTRQLSAIMFTDIVGYTALMGHDEAKAVASRIRHRNVFEEEHASHNGTIVQYYGDGTLSVFKSAVEAANCAIAIQRRLQANDPVPLRIGLHLGDIVFDQTEIYGDGVNFASRIESMSSAGAILLSDKMNDELRNHSAISTVSLGAFELKNISRPVEVFAISNEGITVPASSNIQGKQKRTTQSIAVLPFADMSPEKDHEYFSDGITEEIINALAKVNGLKVTSRTSSFQFKQKSASIKEIGHELGVSTIIAGSVRLSGSTLRITAQLIQSEQDFHFWSEAWDRSIDNIFEVQDEISLHIADRLRQQFGFFEIQDTLVEKQTDNIDAYEFALKANYYLNKWNPEDTKSAIELFEKALELDPYHAASHLGLANAYSFMATTGFMPFAESWEKASAFIQKAQSLNAQSSDVHYLIANEAFFVESNFASALRETKMAVEDNPNNAEAQQFLSLLYILSGQEAQSRKHLNIALSINPLSYETAFFSAYFQYMLRHFEESLKMLDRCLEVNPKNIPAHSIKVFCLLHLGRYDEVINYYGSQPADIVIPQERLGAECLAYILKGDHENAVKAGKVIARLAQEPDGLTADAFLFMMYVVKGEFDNAFAWVRNTLENNSSLLLIRYPDPIVDLLRSDPRYARYHALLFGTSDS